LAPDLLEGSGPSWLILSSLLSVKQAVLLNGLLLDAVEFG
jgi:hypothetical protein